MFIKTVSLALKTLSSNPLHNGRHPGGKLIKTKLCTKGKTFLAEIEGLNLHLCQFPRQRYITGHTHRVPAEYSSSSTLEIRGTFVLLLGSDWGLMARKTAGAADAETTDYAP